MTKIKFCGLTRLCEIEAANELKAEYIGFVFAQKSRRYIAPEKAKELKRALHPYSSAVGVFVNEKVHTVADFLNTGIIDTAQLHGSEDEEYIRQLRTLTDKSVIKAYCIRSAADTAAAEQSSADGILLDSGAGTGKLLDWKLIQNIQRPYFLAGGLEINNVAAAVRKLHPYAVDVSSGIETDGRKDKQKMAAFAAAVRKEEKR